jgi:outer membrane receptor protein involved in Fe transport
MWQLGGIGAALDVRFVGGFKECAGPGGKLPDLDTLQNSTCSFDHTYEHHVPPYATWNAQVSYGIQSRAGRTELALGVQNLLDTRPPRVYSNSYYFPTDPNYDFTGRFYWLRLAHRL